VGVEQKKWMAAPAARSSGFVSSMSKTLTATSASIEVDQAFGAGVDGADRRLTARLFDNATGRYDRSDL